MGSCISQLTLGDVSGFLIRTIWLHCALPSSPDGWDQPRWEAVFFCNFTCPAANTMLVYTNQEDIKCQRGEKNKPCFISHCFIIQRSWKFAHYCFKIFFVCVMWTVFSVKWKNLILWKPYCFIWRELILFLSYPIFYCFAPLIFLARGKKEGF